MRTRRSDDSAGDGDRDAMDRDGWSDDRDAIDGRLLSDQPAAATHGQGWVACDAWAAKQV